MSNYPVRFWSLQSGVDEGSPAARTHALAQVALWRRCTSPRRRLKLITTTVLWSAISAVQAVAVALRFGAEIVRHEGVGRRALAWGAWRAALRHWVPPLSYLKFRLYRPDRATSAADFLHNHEVVALWPMVNAGRDVGVIGDKRRFAAACVAAGVAHVPILATYEGGRLVAGSNDFAEGDLFAKVADLCGGRGVERWDWRKGKYVDPDGRCLTADELRAHLARRSLERPVLVQSRLVNHPDLAARSGGAVCTIRLVTGRDDDGAIVAIMAALRMGVGSAWVDNFSAGGIAAGVDLATGRTGPAVPKRPGGQELTHHPDTGMVIDGFVIPRWHEAVTLCRSAHDRITDLALVGWDVVVTPDGVVLLEGNPTWGVEAVQMGAGPLLRTALPRIVLRELLPALRGTRGTTKIKFISIHNKS